MGTHLRCSTWHPSLCGAGELAGGGADAPPAVRGADLGARLLLELFRGQKECRKGIIALCHSRLLGTKVRGGTGGCGPPAGGPDACAV